MLNVKRALRAMLFAALCAAAGTPIAAQQDLSLGLSLELADLQSSQPPELVGNNQLLLTYDPGTQVRYIAAAFGHENYSTLHYFERNRNGVYLLVYSLPESLRRDGGELSYRLVIDGVWTEDPQSRMTRTDANGIPVSVISVPERPDPERRNPRRLGGNRVRFVLDLRGQREPSLEGVNGDAIYLDSADGHRVSVAGTFNNWDPYMHRLEEDPERPGLYRSPVLRLYPEQHRYYYLIDGERVLDPQHQRVQYSSQGHSVSVFTLTTDTAAR